MKTLAIILIFLFVHLYLFSKEYHVAKSGDDANCGSHEYPFHAIQKAANVAQPGDTIIVHEGIYREYIIPPSGGKSDSLRITYRAADGEKVVVKGSEVIKNWEKVTDGIWKVIIPNSFFGNYNPYKDVIHGNWFFDLGRIHHTGEVYLNGKSLYESDTFEGVLNPKLIQGKIDPEGSLYTWWCENDKNNTYIYANFHKADPNQDEVEINVRKSCFYPDKTGINYITISGFRMNQAATQWASPTAEQIGLIGTNWSKGWIIENNIISDSKCSGITLGKYGDEYDNTAESAEGYNETILRAIKHGWSKENIGHHIVRNNTIFDCEQTGICGSLGAICSQICNNHVYNIWKKRLFAGAEIAGIKIHAPIDVLIKNNRINNCGRGVWLDWMVQGTRITGNLLYNNTTQDVIFEVSHGPYLVDNNLFLSVRSIKESAQGGAYVHNLFAGDMVIITSDRETPYFLPHSTKLAGYKNTMCGDDRYYNNIFLKSYQTDSSITNSVSVPYNNLSVYDQYEFNNVNDFIKYSGSSGLKVYNTAKLPMYVDNNIYYKGAKPYAGESDMVYKKEYDPQIRIEEEDGSVYLYIEFDNSCKALNVRLIDSQYLGKATIPGQAYENPDGTPLRIDTDYLGNRRKNKKPTPGPFEDIKIAKRMKIKVWR